MQLKNDPIQFANQPLLMHHDWELLLTKEQQIPGSVQYSMQRFVQNPSFQFEETGVLSYHHQEGKSKDKRIELRFCITGNRYCTNASCKDGVCRKQSVICATPIETVDVFHFLFPATYLAQFVKGKPIKTRTDQVLSFQERQSFTTTVQLCNRTKEVLQNLINHTYTNALENIYINSQLQTLLLYGLQCLVEDQSAENFVCRFLANDEGRDKINQAREILIQRIGEPITIKELSRRVGTNECYLKKGFKEMFGTTIFDFYQSQRMEHARFLLYDKGLSVTEVSDLLGYSSISHFSTAFKKHTGIKPCELLFRA